MKMKLGCLVAAVMLALMLTACGGNSSSKALVGMWKAVDWQSLHP